MGEKVCMCAYAHVLFNVHITHSLNVDMIRWSATQLYIMFSL